MGSASLAAARPAARPPTRPPARTVTTIPLQPGGLRGKNENQYIRDKLGIVIFMLQADVLPPIFKEVVHCSICISLDLYQVTICPNFNPNQGHIYAQRSI